MEIIIKHKKDKTDVIIFSTGILDEEFYPKHVHRNDLGIGRNTCIVKINSSGIFIDAPKEAEAFNWIKTTILHPRTPLSNGRKLYALLPTDNLRCREFDSLGYPVSQPFIGYLELNLLQINGNIFAIIKSLESHKYKFSNEDKNQIKTEIEKLELPERLIEKRYLFSSLTKIC